MNHNRNASLNDIQCSSAEMLFFTQMNFEMKFKTFTSAKIQI